MNNKYNFDINREWKNSRLPTINGILYEDGSIDCINIDFYERKRTVEYIRKVHINELLSKGELGFSHICVNDKLIHLEKQITVYCGEGSYGGDGFVVVQANNRDDILWTAFFDTANPFVSVEIADETIYATNNLQEKWSFNIDNPKEINIVYLPKGGKMTSKVHFDIAEKYFSEYEKTEDYKLLEEALKSYSDAIELQPDFADAYYKRALVNGLLDELECKYQDLHIAINIYTGLLSQDGNNQDLHYKIALAHMVDYQDNNNKEKALNHFNKALELGYEKPDIFFNIGETYNQFFNTKPNEALPYYNKAIDLAPNKAEYYLARGDCYDLLEQRENAMADFSKGIELAPERWIFYNRRGELFIKLKEWDKAIDDYKEFRKLYPFDRKPKIELLRNIDGGPFFEFHFDTDLSKHSHWHPDSYYLEDCIIVEFLQVFSAVKEFDFYGPNGYKSNELSILLEKLKEHLKLLNNITSYADFFAHIENTHFLNTLIREFNDIETGWESILHQITEITKKLIELLSNAIIKGQYLCIDGI